MVTIQNDGPLIVETDFFESPEAESGCFLSVVPGAFRLLVPRAQAELIETMRQAPHVTVSRVGDRLQVEFKAHALVLLALNMEPSSVDRYPEPEDGASWTFTIWTYRRRPRKVLERSARFEEIRP